MWGVFSDDRTGLSFTIADDPRQRIPWSDYRETYDHMLMSQVRDSYNLKGKVLLFICPRNRVAQLYPQ
jgi:hypothetical protein